jgi:acetyl-CoA carboxylase carboxyltransferase component
MRHAQDPTSDRPVPDTRGTKVNMTVRATPNADVSVSDDAVRVRAQASAEPVAARSHDRLPLLFDPGSVRGLPAVAAERPLSVRAAVGTVGRRPVVAYAQDSSIGGGAVGAAEAETVVRAMERARRLRAPVVAFLESAGARLQDGPAALGGFGRIFAANVALTGVVPQISVITGTSAGGGCYSPALTDFIVMTRAAEMFLTGPRIVHEAVGEVVSSQALGGPRVHERNGVCHAVAADDREAVALVRELLAYLQVPGACADAQPDADPARHVPAGSRQVYDVRDVIADVVDAGRFLELSARWARNLVTGFARVDGHAVGVVANQPRHLGGVLDVRASEKGARFVGACDAYGVPLVVLVDTPGFMPGSAQELSGVIRHGAQLVRAFAAATVPRVTVVLRKAYGGAYITMNSKELGGDPVLAWTGAEIGIMGPDSAVTILHRRRLGAGAAPPGLAGRLADEYAARHIAAHNACRLGLVDAVIEPHETRGRVAAAVARLL